MLTFFPSVPTSQGTGSRSQTSLGVVLLPEQLSDGRQTEGEGELTEGILGVELTPTTEEFSVPL